MASSADIAEVASSAELAEVPSSADLAGDVTVSVTSLADPASVVTAGVAFKHNYKNSVVIPSDCVCLDDDVAEVVPSAELAGNVGVTSLADPVSVATAGVAFREKCGNSVMVPSGSVCDHDDYFYDGHYDDRPDYFDYDNPGDFDSYPSVYGFVGPDNYELYHDLHGRMTVGCIVYNGVMSA